MSEDKLLNFASKRAALLNLSSAWGTDEDGVLLIQLITRIEQLSAEVEAWKADAERYHDNAYYWNEHALLLREALDNIANESSDTWARETARAALEGKQ